MALKTYNLPPDTRAPGSPDPAGDMNSVVDTLVALNAQNSVLSQVYAGGADPTGAADSTAAFQQCASAAASAGCPMIIPSGTYSISGTITLATGLVIQGYGENTTTINQTSAINDTFQATDQRYITIRDLRLTGPGSGTGRGIALLFSASALAGINLFNVRVSGFGGDGVHLETPITSTLIKVRSESNGGAGFFISGGTSVSLKACYANACTGNGYELDAVNYCQLDSCASDSVPIGYQINGSSAVVLNGCGAEVVSVAGYKVTGGSANVTMLCCKVLQSSGIGFWITGSSVFNFLLGTREASPAGGATAGNRVDSGSTATVVSPQNTTANNFAAGTTQLFLRTNLEIHSAGDAFIRADRGATSNTAKVSLQTAGADKWSMQMSPDSTSDWHLINNARSQEPLGVLDQATAANLWLITKPAGWGSMAGGAFLHDASTVPSSDPAAGGFLYSDNGILKWRDKYGGVIQVAPREPSPSMLYGAPAGATAQTCNRDIATATSSATLTSGAVYVRAIIMAANTVVNSASLFTAAANVATQANITHGWYALLDNAYKVQAVSADQIAVAFLTATSTEYNLALTSGGTYTTTYTGLYFLAQSITISAGNMPQFTVSGSVGTGAGSAAPVLHGTAGTQNAPPALAATLTTPTFLNSNVFYAYTK